MKILIPNAKELNTNLDSQSFHSLPKASQEVLSVLNQMTVQELANLYKMKLNKAELELDRWQRITQKQARLYPAWLLYDGLMYRYMSRRDLSEAEVDYLKEHVFITTSFYGAISVFESIAPHRLDFQASLKIGSKSLKQYWRSQYDQLVQDDELIISLLSSEFEAVFSPSIQKRMINITFMEETGGQLKLHSTISKKGRGLLVSEMARNNVQSLEELRTLQVDGFYFREELSKEKEMVFVRQVS